MPRAEFEARLAQYETKLREHQKTVGVPAPWEDNDLIRNLARMRMKGEPVEIVPPPPPETPPPRPITDLVQNWRSRGLTSATLADLKMLAIDALLTEMLEARRSNPSNPPEIQAYFEATAAVAARGNPPATGGA